MNDSTTPVTKINELTPEQEAMIPVTVNKWTNIGLSTEPVSLDECRRIVGDFNKHILNGADRPVFLLNSPIEAWYFVCLNTTLDNPSWTTTLTNPKKVDPGVSTNPKELRLQIDNQVWEQIFKQIDVKIANSIRKSIKPEDVEVVDFIAPYACGQFDAGYFAWVDYMISIGVQNIPEITKYYLETSKVGMIFPLDNCIVVCQKPTVVKKNASGLHCENGPALSYGDNGVSEWYYLNGVNMKKEQVMTPAEQMDVRSILSETNAEVRRELIRKIGIGRFLEICNHKVLDVMGDYELLSIELSTEVPDARYLKMTNPSVGCFHVEAVAPECDTVQKAINWRAYGNTDAEWSPNILT